MTSEEDVAAAAEKIPALVTMISGCKDCQTSADVSDVSGFDLPANCGPGGAGGACTTALVSVLQDPETPKPISWQDMLLRMRGILGTKGYTQIPQLSSSRQLGMSQDFDILQGCPPSRAKALLVGINYVGQEGELSGCHNDVLIMVEQLTGMGFLQENMRILMDDGESPDPTKQNMVDGFDWLCEGAEAGDARFMHYSGHGGSVADTSGDEEDGKDECLIPSDYNSGGGLLLDDTISEHLIFRMPRDVNLMCLMDCCHSGSIMDLPFMCRMDDNTVEQVEQGGTPSMVANPNFNMKKFKKVLGTVCKECMADFGNCAKAPNAANVQSLCQKVLSKLFKGMTAPE